MKIKTLAAAAALTLFVGAMPAMAVSERGNSGKKNGWTKSQRGQFDKHFANFDRNGDGVVTRAEFPADASLFAQLDLNRDGLLTRAEVVQAVPDRASAERLARGYDRNGDGIITRSEFPGNATAFSRLDRNGDGVITQADHGKRGKKAKHRD
jgi:Ca2+-binding EF-hand superfamily protein